MKNSFLNTDKPLLTAMIKQTQNPENCISEIKRAMFSGADAIGIQLEGLPRRFHKPKILKEIFGSCERKPIYVTNYRICENTNIPYEELAEELINYIDYGATLCDVTGDMFCKSEDELTFDSYAIKNQLELIDKIHSKGGEVVMSSHVNKFIKAERVLEIAREHKNRGADISKIVVHADTMEEQIENLRITNILCKNIEIPFLFLSGGECLIHRRLGILLGCCMSLCVCELPEGSNNPQPLLEEQRLIRDKMHLI